VNLFVRRAAPRNLYDVVSEGSSAVVIRQYSSSFGLASRLLAEPVRTQVRNIYALVRVADEIVDNPDLALGPGPRERMLTWLHDDVRHALDAGYSGNLVVHAFARTATLAGIDVELVDPFFDSMRMDLTATAHTRASFDRYVYGSAEVVGLMCLAAFLVDEAVDDDRRARLQRGAIHLGAAFQKINFLRDLAVDWRTLGRNYFPGVDPDAFTEDDKTAILDDIDRDLDIAHRALPELPRRARSAVAAAHGLFASLTARCRATPASEIMATRIRVPDGEKLAIAVRSALGTGGNRR
jgi:phytoene synthase